MALKEGNGRFVAGKPEHPGQSIEYRAGLTVAQRPTAVVFGCADSRVAAEIIFDQGLGDMFVVRTAGHVIDSAVLGSIEYAVTVLDVPLIVVLGHDSCGAVKATLAALDEGKVPGGAPPDGWTALWQPGGIGPKKRWGTVLAARNAQLEPIHSVGSGRDRFDMDSMWPGYLQVADVRIDDSYWVTQPGTGMTPQTYQGTPTDGDFKTGLFDIDQSSLSVRWGALRTTP